MVDTYYYTDSNDDYDSLVTIKIFLALGIFFVSVASASAPLTVIRIDDHVFSLGNMFSAGILFAAGLVHQLPDSAERLNGALSFDTDFPLASFLAGSAFVFFLMLEEYLHTRMEETGTPDPFQQQQQQQHHHGLGLVFEKESKQKQKQKQEQNQHEPAAVAAAGAAAAESSPALRPHESSSLLVAHDPTRQECLIEPFEAADNSNNNSNSNSDNNISSNNVSSNNISNSNNCSVYIRSSSTWSSNRSLVVAAGGGRESTTTTTTTTTPTQTRTLPHGTRSSHGHGLLDSMRDQSFGHEHPVHYHEEHLADHARGSLLSSVALLVALSLHSVLEAVAIGAASTRRTVVSTVSAVLAHKAFAGYALGSAMVAAHVKRWHVLVLGCVFGACSIVGVALGLLLERTVVRHANGNANTNGNGNGNASENEGVPIGIVQAVVAGTFLYVAIVEIAMKELLTHRGGGDLPVGDCQVRKLVAFWIGYLVMSVFALWV